MLREQERLGIVKANANTNVLSGDDIERALFNRKVWHDHGKIAGHGHFLVLVCGIYDPAFYYTEQELQDLGVDVDVVNVVERPGIHVIARSGSADCDQMAYSETRVECLLEIDFSFKTQSGQPITHTVTTQRNNSRLEMPVVGITHV